MSDPTTILHDPSAALDLIEARAQAATEGPWVAESFHGDEFSVPITSPGTDLDNPVAEPGPVDATFIAHARTDVPWLVDLARRQDAALRAVLDLVDGCENVARRHADKATRETHRAIAADFRTAITAALSEVTR